MQRSKGIIFDLDGTLADTLPLCVFSFQEALQNITGNRPSREEVEAYFGYSEEGIVRNLLPKNWNPCMEEFLSVYEKHHYMCENLFDGIKELLDYLKGNNVNMAMVTGKGQHSARITLNKLDINHYFEYVETGSPKGSIKPECIKRILNKWSVLPSDIFYVGDSYKDITDSKEVGAISVAAGWASTANLEILKKYDPHYMFKSVEEFDNWIKKQF